MEHAAGFRREFDQGGIQRALAYLNARTPFRFTGIYRFDSPNLRNLHLYDRWAPGTLAGADAPMAQTYCGVVLDSSEGALQVDDGAADDRFPWMNSNAVVSYCGVMIRDEQGKPFGTLCHFDLQRCEQSSRELDVLKDASQAVYGLLSHSG